MRDQPQWDAAPHGDGQAEADEDTVIMPSQGRQPPGRYDIGVARRPARTRNHSVIFARVMFSLVLLVSLLGVGGVWALRTVGVAQRTLNDLKYHLTHIESVAPSISTLQPTALQAVQSDLAPAEADLRTLDSLIPLQGQLDVGGLGAAHRVLRLGSDALVSVQEGITAATVLQPALQGFMYSLTHSQADLQAHGDHVLTLQDVHVAQRHLALAKNAWSNVRKDRLAISSGDLQSLHNAQVTRLVQKLDTLAPSVASGFNLASAVLDWSPRALGLSGPIHFLLFDMDSDELRATGGFQGNYADLTVSGGALTSGVHLHDIYTLDCPNQDCPPRPVPAEYSWFPLADGLFGVRDANLNPDFPTSAGLTAHLYELEAGHSVDAVIAITPAVVEGIMRAVGPVQVNPFGVTVTADNLRNLLHFYHQNPQIAEGLGISASALGTSINKVFDVLVAQALFAKLAALTAQQQTALAKSLSGYLKTKDIQVFVNNTRVEDNLAQFGVAGQVIKSQGDSVFVVDTNDGASYANADVQEAITDVVTLDAKGGASHALAVTHTFADVQHDYVQTYRYSDLVRVIVPRTATHLNVNGPCAPVSTTQSDHLVLACQFSLQRGASSVISFSWYVPGVLPSGSNQSYQLLLQRQAGANDAVHVSVLPPAGATLALDGTPGKVVNGHVEWSATPLTADTTLAATVHR
jgi:hypothetical protein